MKVAVIYDLVKNIRDTMAYIINNFSGPAPAFVKFKILKKYSDTHGDWIETGTYEGSMTSRLRGVTNKIVISFEPSKYYYIKSTKRLKVFKNVIVINSTSEEGLPKVVDQVGESVNFWLDGHFSDKKTYGRKSFCPLREELDIISKQYLNKNNIVIFVDDVRLCSDLQERDPAYPSVEYLTSWAAKHDFKYIIENDIFILKKLNN